MADVLIDWFEFTVLPGDNDGGEWVDEVLESIKLWFGDFEVQQGGFFGYEKSALFYNSARVLWSVDNWRMGVHVSFPSSGLGSFAVAKKHYLDGGGLGFLRFVRSFELAVRDRGCGFQVSRVDFALDDRDGFLDFDEMSRKTLDKAEITTVFREAVVPYQPLFGRDRAETIYYGSAKSDTRLRIYNKALEQKKDDVHWLRVEIQARHKRADALYNRVLSEGLSFIPGYLLKYLDFKQVNAADTNKRRWLSADWWVDFLGTCSKSALCLPKIEKSIERAANWLADSVSGSLFMVVKAFEEIGVLDITGLLVDIGHDKFAADRTKQKPRAIAAFLDTVSSLAECSASEVRKMLIEECFQSASPSAVRVAAGVSN